MEIRQKARISRRKPLNGEHRSKCGFSYNFRANAILEEAREDKLTSVELSIAGRLYVIDMKKGTQVQKGFEDDSAVTKLVKRDVSNAPCKGVAGLAYK